MKYYIILCLLSLWVVEGRHGAIPVRLPPTVIDQEGENVCPSQMATKGPLSTTKEIIKQSINKTVNRLLNSPTSCGGIGWTRVAYLDMRDPGSVCPTNWTLHTSPVRGCGQTQTAFDTCDSAFFSAQGLNYSRVCGRILAYQKGSPEAFHGSSVAGRTSIDSAYVDGVSLTHGPVGARQHIWTFAAAKYEDCSEYSGDENCYCTNIRRGGPRQLPSFMGDNYFCDTASESSNDIKVFYSGDPLWDGAGCGYYNGCCEFKNPPWFYSSLPQASEDDVEVRLCFSSPSYDEDTIIYLMELYVQP